tara:strand:+ start:2200 stop:2550 length:351 start_codon:yes stop_codon:yes gene_type:complete
MGIQKIIVCLTSLLIIGCTPIKKEVVQEPLNPVKPEFNGNFPSFDLRLMWQSCAVQFIPLRINPHVYAPYCDCATDFMRRRYNKEQVKALKAEEAKKLGPLINAECQPKVPVIQPT